MIHYLIDTETTGRIGYPKDLVLDIGIVSVDTQRRKVERVYQSYLGYDVDSWSDYHRNAWIFDNSELTLNDIRDAMPAEDVIEEVRDIVKGQVVTSYNVAFDFGRFLNLPPWELPDVCRVGECVMIAAGDYFKIPHDYFESYRWPKLSYAYAALTKDDPAGINGIQKHTALSDAFMAGYVLLELYERGHYSGGI